MNTTAIIAAIIALLGGFAAGTTMQDNNVPEVNPTPTISDIAANDFISMRPGISDLPQEALSQEEIDGLLFMREEEKLARDVYQTLYEKWGLPIFANIAQSEQTHTEAVRDLLEKYNLTDPVTDDTVGVFVNPQLARLYTTLVAQGNRSEIDALTTGATIEDLDINDLAKQLALADNQDIKLVYENLTRASRNHLRSFSKQLSMRGVTYEPQYISTDAYAGIVDSSLETGMQQGGGVGAGTGAGNGRNNRGWGGGTGGGRR